MILDNKTSVGIQICCIILGVVIMDIWKPNINCIKIFEIRQDAINVKKFNEVISSIFISALIKIR